MSAPPLVALPASPDLVRQVHARVLDAIGSGAWPAGTRLTQEQVAEQLGVSRQPVLQAFRMLIHEGLLLETSNRKGVHVAPLDAGFVAQLYELRAALDAAAARAAARRPRPELREAGEALMRAGRRAARSRDLRALVDADLAFHRFVFEAAGNPLLTRTADVHWHHTRRAMSAYLQLPASFEGIWQEHRRILDAILDGRPDAAAEESRLHAEASARLLLAGMPAVASG